MLEHKLKKMEQQGVQIFNNLPSFAPIEPPDPHFNAGFIRISGNTHCPAGHQLYRATTEKLRLMNGRVEQASRQAGFTCNMCQRAIPVIQDYFTCREICDYDLCKDCVDAELATAHILRCSNSHTLRLRGNGFQKTRRNQYGVLY